MEKASGARVVECVPNFSEGRDAKVVEAIAGAIAACGVRVLDVQRDADHNRCVVTFLGSPEACKRAALAGARVAVERIDMNRHQGAHPRVGAVDVIPLVPVSGITMEECVAHARELATALWSELRLPVYFYEEAATRPERRNLEDVRRGQYEGLREAVRSDPSRAPDVGEAALHPTAGAVVVGARAPLIAFNVNLGTSDLALAQRIAKGVRHSSGGFRYVKAMGVKLEDRRIVQVSMNLTNFRGTPIHRVFETIRNEAEAAGVSVVGSEIVGLVPMDALVDAARHFLRIENFAPEQVLERRLLEE
ncbi:MAG TPA: glutamate formimidoyltransferase [Candidatus Thermoplasmatota archaeon]|nr:glutamate formimidoyltransferase [Candidatus Thermoplasmatota archaeon]